MTVFDGRSLRHGDLCVTRIRLRRRSRKRLLIALMALLAVALLSRPAAAQNVWVGYPWLSSEPYGFDYLDTVELWYDAAWDLSYACDTVWADYVALSIGADDGWYGGDYLFPGEYYNGWTFGPFYDYVPGYYMVPTTYGAYLGVSYHDSYWESDYEVGAYSYATAYPMYALRCPGDPERSHLVDEYYQRQLDNWYVPACGDIVADLDGSYSWVTWAGYANHSANDGWTFHNAHLGILQPYVAGIADYTFVNYIDHDGRVPTITSGYRSPNGAVANAASRSQHLRGNAMDLQDPGRLDSAHHPTSPTDTSSDAYWAWYDLLTYATQAGATYIESLAEMYQRGGNQASAMNHMHFDRR